MFTIKFNKLQFVNIIYWLFLTYMVAAFIWWYVSLSKQNNQIAIIQKTTIVKNDPQFDIKIKTIESIQERKKWQFLGEAITFLCLFFLGAVYVYRSLIKQIAYSNQQQNFMMAVTHELKTPIAVTQLNVETILKRDLSAEQQKQLLQNALKETQRLDTLCNNILLAAELDWNDYQQNKQNIDFSNLVELVLKQFKERYVQRNFIATIQPGVDLIGEPLLLQMLLHNLIDNAHKYAPIETPIEIVLSQHNNQLILQVKDQGVGIPLTERDKVFEKFYRVGTEFTRATKGTGLGLYLSKKIATFHGAILVIQDNKPKGTIVSLTI